MNKKEQTVFLTGDSNAMSGSVLHKADLEARDLKGAVEVSPEQLMKIAELAKAKYDACLAIASQVVTPERAEKIRTLRVTYSWRSLADACYDDFGGSAHLEWAPRSNQLMGMALCRRACDLLGEDGSSAPWC